MLEKGEKVDEEGKKWEKDGHHVLWSDTLARVLKDGNVKVVVLNTCQSAGRDPRRVVWAGVAVALLKAGIPAVVAIQFNISDETAISFAQDFYKALASGLSLDEAVAYGRRVIMERDDDKRDQDWGLPVLYTRSEFSVLKGTEALRNECYAYLYPEVLEASKGD